MTKVCSPASATLPFGRMLSYSFGQVAGQVYRDVPSLLLLIFLTNVIGIEPGLAGLAIFIPKLIVGIVADFVVGAVADRSPRLWPRWVLAGACLAPIAMALLFKVPAGSETLKIAYIVATFSFYMSVFSVFSVPYFAIASRLSDDPHQRTVLMAWRLGFASIGVLIASGAAPYVISKLGGGQSAYEALGYLLGLLCFAVLLLSYLGIRGAAPFKPPADESTVNSSSFSLADVARALSQRHFAVLVTTNLIQLVAAGMAYAAFLYFLIYNMRRTDAFEIIPILVFIICAGILIAQPVWVSLAKRFGKKPVFIFATFLHACVSIAFGLSDGDFSLFTTYLLMFALGVSNSGWTLLGFSMVTDIASESDASIYAAAWGAADKIGFALGGTALIGVTLQAFGFSAADAVAGLPQSERAVRGIAMAYGFIPAGLYSLAGVYFWIFGEASA